VNSESASIESTLERRLNIELERASAAALYRRRRVVDGQHGVALVVDGREVVNFCSNDYLGLASDPRLAAAAAIAAGQCGWGSGASALVSGYNREHQALEEALAAYVGRPRALLFSSGWAANLGVLRALFGREDALLCDELNHASLIDGARLSGARYVRISHCDTSGYESALQMMQPAANVGIVTDSIFSMDGDSADVPALAAMAQRHQATLIVDDAHGFAVSAETNPAMREAEVYIATLGKSLGSAGAFVAGSETLIEYLIQRARTWVFSTAPPPAAAAVAHAALRLITSEPEHQQRLRANIDHFRAAAAARSLPITTSRTPIQPLILGEASRALALSHALDRNGFWVAAIRPPTVPAGTSRLRITLSAAHRPDQINALVDTLASLMPQFPSESEV